MIRCSKCASSFREMRRGLTLRSCDKKKFSEIQPGIQHSYTDMK